MKGLQHAKSDRITVCGDLCWIINLPPDGSTAQDGGLHSKGVCQVNVRCFKHLLLIITLILDASCMIYRSLGLLLLSSIAYKIL